MESFHFDDPDVLTSYLVGVILRHVDHSVISKQSRNQVLSSLKESKLLPSKVHIINFYSRRPLDHKNVEAILAPGEKKFLDGIAGLGNQSLDEDELSGQEVEIVLGSVSVAVLDCAVFGGLVWLCEPDGVVDGLAVDSQPAAHAPEPVLHQGRNAASSVRAHPDQQVAACSNSVQEHEQQNLDTIDINSPLITIIAKRNPHTPALLPRPGDRSIPPIIFQGHIIAHKGASLPVHIAAPPAIGDHPVLHCAVGVEPGQELFGFPEISGVVPLAVWEDQVWLELVDDVPELDLHVVVDVGCAVGLPDRVVTTRSVSSTGRA
jgi:hypothetical protein